MAGAASAFSPGWKDDEQGGELDEALDEDMEAVRNACMITGKSSLECERSSDHGSECGSSDIDDLDLVRRIQRRFPIPLAVIPPPSASISPSRIADSDSDDDLETLRAIQRRFANYGAASSRRCSDQQLERTAAVSPISRNNKKAAVLDELTHSHVFCAINQQNSEFGSLSEYPSRSGFLTPLKKSRFPASAQKFIDAVRKNRSCQRFIRKKLMEIEAKIEENKQLLSRVKCLMDFQTACKRKAGKVLGQYRDPRIKLISLPKRSLKTGKKKYKTHSVLCTGPEENAHVQNYNNVMKKYPVSFNMQNWSVTERENLAKGIKQQLQETLLQKFLDQYSDSESGDHAALDDIIASISDLEIGPENLRSFLPQVDWDRLVSMYVIGRSGAECQARWLNSEDPMINHSPWTNLEDKKLLFIVQQRGIYNWIEISTSLGTNRTPCQCLTRYQRSLNAYIMKKEWMEDEDTLLRTVVEAVGDYDWQLVASHLEGRTGRQCAERWLKTLHPSRERVGRWTVDEDKYLKVAVLIFESRNWPKIAKFVPGRTQVQCRERWYNVLSPSLSLKAWSDDEDAKLKAAIAEYGHSWSKVAAQVPPRTDNQCRRRWKILFPHELSLAQAARKIQRAALLTNFVDRQSERSTLGPDDFFIASGNIMLEEDNYEINNRKKRKLRSKKCVHQGDANGNVKSVSSRKTKVKCRYHLPRTKYIHHQMGNLRRRHIQGRDILL